METLLLISGSTGVGKTTIANELSNLLNEDNVPHTYLDLDALTCTFPRDNKDPYGEELAIENLNAVWLNCKQHGSKNLIIPRVIEADDYTARLSKLLDIPNPQLCRLTASDQTLLQRIRKRELGSGLAWHEHRCLELSALLEESKLEDFCIPTDDRSVTAIATELMGKVSWVR